MIIVFNIVSLERDTIAARDVIFPFSPDESHIHRLLSQEEWVSSAPQKRLKVHVFAIREGCRVHRLSGMLWSVSIYFFKLYIFKLGYR